MTPVARQLTPPAGWIHATARVRPLTFAQLRPLTRALAWALRKRALAGSRHRDLPQLFTVLLHHPRLFWPWLRFAARLMPFGRLPRRDTELAILRVSWNCRCRYEWGQHVLIALAQGLTPRAIAGVAQGPEAPGWSPRERALLRAADELHGGGSLTDATWSQLEAYYDVSELIEVPMLIGHYQMLAGLIHSVGLSLEPEIEAALARAPIHEPPDALSP